MTSLFDITSVLKKTEQRLTLWDKQQTLTEKFAQGMTQEQNACYKV
jgi:hypothetical protein